MLSPEEQANFQTFAQKCDRSVTCPQAQLAGRLAAVRGTCGASAAGHRRQQDGSLSLVLGDQDIHASVESVEYALPPGRAAA